MKLIGLFIQNYGSFYGRHYIPLADRGLVSVIGENLDDPRSRSNGAGKSTWSDALDWCLFGENPRGDTAASVVNDLAGSECTVTVQILGDDGQLIQVTRLRDHRSKPNGPTLLVNGEDKSALDSRETQERIERTIGLDRTVFHAAVLFSQSGHWQFADATDGERKALLTKILPELAEVDDLAVRADSLLVAAEKRRQEVVARVSWLDGQYQASLAADPRPRVAQWEHDHAERIRVADAEAAAAQAALAEVLVEQAALQVSTPPPPVPGVPVELLSLRQAVRERRAAYQARDVALGGLRAQAAALLAQVRKLSDPAATRCNACGQVLGVDARAHVADELYQVDSAYRAAVDAGQAEKAALDALLLQVQADEHDLATHEDAWRAGNAEAERAVARYQEAARMQDAVSRRVQAARQQVDRRAAAQMAVRAEQNPILDVVKRWEDGLSALRSQSEDAATGLRDLDARVAGLQFWKTGLGAKGLKSYLLDSKIQEMSQEANRWVRLLTGGTVSVEFATQRQVGTGKNKRMAEDFSIRVLRANPDGTVTSRGYRSWSGGEKYRIGLGIDFGLARLVAKRAARAYDLMILDEVFQKSLDSSGKEAVAEMLQELVKEKSTIFVIDHDVQFQHVFDGRMVIQKRHRRSCVVGGVHYGVEPAGQAGSGAEAEANGRVLADHSAFP